MGVYLNPGNYNYRRACNSQIYVDKTELITLTNNVIDTEQRFICISRPRRFGKSMAANMLTAYYGKNCDSSEIFEKYKIAECESYRKNLNQYNVIAVNVQNFLSVVNSVEELISSVQSEILIELKENYSDKISEQDKILSMALEKIFSKTEEGFVFIIDEWDCILREKKYTAEDHKKYLDFIRNLLKDKSYVSLAYMTGILPIKKYGTHSALNMFDEYSMTDPGDYAEYIGFTEKEVAELCEKYKVDFEKEKEWYDGYGFNNELHIYNPKSVVDSIRRKNFSSYWTQTETYEALKCYVKMNYDGLKDAIIQMLAGENVKIDYRTFQNDMTTFEGRDDVLTLLVHLGYLAYNNEKSEVFIPNAEVRAEFVRAIKGCNWSEVITSIEKSEQLLHATWEMQETEVAKMIDEVHMQNTSILTYNDENSLSCVISLAYYYAINEYTKIRELPTGKGFADIVYIPRKHSDKPAMIVELKYDKSAEGAIAQIKEKKYIESLKEYQGNLLLVGISYEKNTKRHTCVIEKYVKEYGYSKGDIEK